MSTFVLSYLSLWHVLVTSHNSLLFYSTSLLHVLVTCSHYQPLVSTCLHIEIYIPAVQYCSFSLNWSLLLLSCHQCGSSSFHISILLYLLYTHPHGGIEVSSVQLCLFLKLTVLCPLYMCQFSPYAFY